jgi:hypothetical protein
MAKEKKLGRPRMGNAKMRVVQVFVSDGEFRALLREANRRKQSMSSVARGYAVAGGMGK